MSQKSIESIGPYKLTLTRKGQGAGYFINGPTFEIKDDLKRILEAKWNGAKTAWWIQDKFHDDAVSYLTSLVKLANTPSDDVHSDNPSEYVGIDYEFNEDEEDETETETETETDSIVNINPIKKLELLTNIINNIDRKTAKELLQLNPNAINQLICIITMYANKSPDKHQLQILKTHLGCASNLPQCINTILSHYKINTGLFPPIRKFIIRKKKH